MPNNMGSDRSRKQWFELALPHIPYCGPDEDIWISGRALEAATGLTEHRRSAAINWGRQWYCPAQDWALVSGRRGYRFVTTSKQTAPFTGPRYKAASTLVWVSYLGAQKPLIKRAVATGTMGVHEAKLIETSIERALQDLQTLGAILP